MAFNHSDTDRIAVYPNRPQKTMVASIRGCVIIQREFDEI